ncbi:GTPase Era [Blattabacterium cuenoti]|uniref:GTPase Era n=1 Tax=Blattabacterium cuenoti TaxID=1653831 RepID=UPI00163C3AB1|nr:GTPase Era [Blattabacterium cuenoti]
MIYKSGFVNIIGFPNVGKSTLINSLVGKNISIITHKPQTTRHRVLGILNKKNFQIIFSDTPGMIIKKVFFIQKIMMLYIKKSLEDADIILFITEIGKFNFVKEYFYLLNNIYKKKNIPIIILINKIDQIGIKYKENLLYKTIYYWDTLFPNIEILPISALKKINQELLINKILNYLNEHPPYFPKEWISDRSERFFVNEIIRETIFLLYQKEIPYSSEVVTEQFKKYNIFIYIFSFIYVERDSQKGILIGYKGKSLNKLKNYSIKKIENFFKKKIFLKIQVKICKNWRSNYQKLKNFGY